MGAQQRGEVDVGGVTNSTLVRLRNGVMLRLFRGRPVTMLTTGRL
jgi:hypothetical protein